MSTSRLFSSVALVMLVFHTTPTLAQQSLLLRPDRVFDGTQMHRGWVVLVGENRIVAAGPADQVQVPRGSQTMDLAGLTLLPGLIEGHSHLLLHPYDETPWTDQVLNESLGQRIARGVVHAERTLMAGVTTERDLGTEGAGYGDVGLKEAIELGVIPGPRLKVTTKAIVATGSYNPKGAPELQLPKGAEAADGHDDLIRITRDQIGRGADWVKIYADYRWGPNGTNRPSFTEAELRLVVDVAESSGRHVVAHANSADAMRRSVLAGVKTIEHGDEADREVLELMAERGVALCPTLAASDAVLQYRGWRKGVDPEPERIRQKRTVFRMALEIGVPMCFGGDVGVYAHGENVRELELMVDYGMSPLATVQAATSGRRGQRGTAGRSHRGQRGSYGRYLSVAQRGVGHERGCGLQTALGNIEHRTSNVEH
jgi:imidazolonepropionase-like amidohydrolase